MWKKILATKILFDLIIAGGKYCRDWINKKRKQLNERKKLKEETDGRN